MVLLLLPPKKEMFLPVQKLFLNQDGVKLFVLFEAKENQKALTGPNSHPRLKDSIQFVHEFLKALHLPGA